MDGQTAPTGQTAQYTPVRPCGRNPEKSPSGKQLTGSLTRGPARPRAHGGQTAPQRKTPFPKQHMFWKMCTAQSSVLPNCGSSAKQTRYYRSTSDQTTQFRSDLTRRWLRSIGMFGPRVSTTRSKQSFGRSEQHPVVPPSNLRYYRSMVVLLNTRRYYRTSTEQHMLNRCGSSAIQ